MIVIIDYGAGNVGSVKNMIKRIGFETKITSDIDEINMASHIILPGVGSFDFGMNQLYKHNLLSVLDKKVFIDKIPILGICLGMQLMAKSSEEGTKKGLGWFDAKVVKFKNDITNIKIPNMGWNYIYVKKKSKLLDQKAKDLRFYFTHSYYVKVNNENDVLAITDYGGSFTSAIEKDNIFGVQFHPEKSHKYGLTLFKKFLEL